MDQGVYRFPILDHETIIETLDGYSITVRQTQLRQPTPEFVYGLCCQMVQKLTGITPASLTPVADQAIANTNVQFPEMHRVSTVKLLMGSQIARMARAADVSDYTSRDLAMPDSHRTCVLLSAFINYLAHCQSQADIVQQVRDDAYAVRDKRDEVAKKAAAAQKALQELRSVRAAENDREKDLRFMVNAAAPDIIRLLQEKTELEQAVGKIKDDRDKLARRKEDAMNRISKLQEQIQTTQSRIVRSPERIRKNISSMSGEVIDRRRTLGATEAKIRELQAKEAAFSTIAQEVRICLDQLSAIEKEGSLLADAEKQLQDASDSRDKAARRKEALSLETGTLVQQRNNALARLQLMKQQASLKQASYKQTLERLRKENEELVKERHENDVEVGHIVRQADEIEQRMQMQMQETQVELSDLLGAYFALRQQGEVYRQAIEVKLGLGRN